MSLFSGTALNLIVLSLTKIDYDSFGQIQGEHRKEDYNEQQ